MINILLIEDNADDIELANRALARLGVTEQVDIVRDGREALDYLFRQGAYAGREKSPSLQMILLDLNLPKISGLEVIRQVRSNPGTSQIPIVVLTVSRKEPDLLQSFTMGVSDYLVKPIEPDRFARVYEKYVKGVSTP